MHSEKFDGTDKALERRRKLSLNRRSTRIIGKNTADNSERNRQANAKNVERLQEHRVKQKTQNQYIATNDYIPHLAEVPAELEPAIRQIEKVLEITAPFAGDDIDDYVLCASTGNVSREELVKTCLERFGGCPARAVVRRFGLDIDASRVIVKPTQIGEWCVIQIFRNVSLRKLMLIWSIMTAWLPDRKLVRIDKRADFEAIAASHEAGEATDEIAFALWGSGHTDPQINALIQLLSENNKKSSQRLNGMTRYSTQQDEDRNTVNEWVSAVL